MALAALWAGFMCLISGSAYAQEALDSSKAEIETIPLRGGIYMLVGDGGNLGVSTGKDSVFLIDDQYAPLTPKIQAAIAEVAHKPIQFVFNTHWHLDHAGGNENLGNAGAIIVAHDQARLRMSTDHFVDLFQQTLPASPQVPLPVVTFNDTTTFHINGQTIHAFSVAPAHTDGDVVLHFKEADVIHTGDVYFNKIYPLIDVPGGGSFDGLIAAVDEILSRANDNTQIIPGHGPLSNRAEVLVYRDMLVDVGRRIKSAISQGMPLEKILASNPTAAYDAVWGQNYPTAEAFISNVYKALVTQQLSTQTSASVLAAYPQGAFLENLETQPDGRLLYTNYPTKTIEQLSVEGETSTFATLSAYPLGIISIDDGYLVTANGKSILLGEDATDSQQLLILDTDGNQVGQFDAPKAEALNGLVKLNNGDILVADSSAATIWKVDPKKRRIKRWLKHDLLARPENQELYVPGVNGLKLRSDGLVASNTSKGTLLLIKIGRNGRPIGVPEVIAEVGIIDDFWVKEDDSILFTTHADSVKSLSKEGDIAVVATQYLLGNTAISPFPPNQSNSYAVVTDGGLYFGSKETAKVVLLSVNNSPEQASKALVTRFFSELWNPPYKMEVIDELVSDDFVITNAGTDIVGKEGFKKWVQALGSQFIDLRLHIEEIVATADGQRVTARMIASGRNNGAFGTKADKQPITLTVTAIVAVKEGKIVHNWVEKSALELQQKIISAQKKSND